MAGRKPLGPALVEHLDGSTSAKERLELILETLAGQVTVVRACRDPRHQRGDVLQAAQSRPAGLPGGPGTQAAGPAAAVRDRRHQRGRGVGRQGRALEDELAAQTVRLELARVLPQLGWRAEGVKKTKRQPRKKHRRK